MMVFGVFHIIYASGFFVNACAMILYYLQYMQCRCSQNALNVEISSAISLEKLLMYERNRDSLRWKIRFCKDLEVLC